MSQLYFDSSALVKYYIIEPGTAWVRSAIDRRVNLDWEHEIATSILSVAEVVSAFAKRRRVKDISSRLCAGTISRFLREGRHRCRLVGVSESVVDLAVQLVQGHPLRAYDAVQLATALRLNQILRQNRLPSLTFVSADAVLCQVAQAEGLTTVNPNELENEHPATGNHGSRL